MAENGKLEKMLILAFETSEEAENGGKAEAKDSFEALINPETYTLEYKVRTADEQGQGTSSAQARFEYTMPEELTFEFLFDNTGIIDGKAKKDGIFDDVNHFRELLTKYQGSSHEPYHLKLVWGNLIFKGRAIEVGITYKLFNPGRSTNTRGREGEVQGKHRREETRREGEQKFSRLNPPAQSQGGRHPAVDVLSDLRRPQILSQRGANQRSRQFPISDTGDGACFSTD